MMPQQCFMSNNPIRVMVVENHQLILWALTKLINDHRPDMEVTAVASTPLMIPVEETTAETKVSRALRGNPVTEVPKSGPEWAMVRGRGSAFSCGCAHFPARAAPTGCGA